MQAAHISALVYVGITTVLFSIQTRLIFPGASTQGQAGGAGSPAAGHRDRQFEDQ